MKLASLAILFVASASADKYGGGGDGYGKVEASGTACIVKVLFSLVFFGEIIHFVFLSIQGSYCNCHYCKCEKGSVHCDKHGYGETTFIFQNISVNKNKYHLNSQARSTALAVPRASTATATSASAPRDSALPDTESATEKRTIRKPQDPGRMERKII